ncbi:MAG: DNA-processing protein DprA [Rhodobacterales bacterium]|nr:DNA-processing protein DprA [Rhodobacterales bacterium]
MTEEFHPSTHPPLPPTTEDDRVLWLRLLRSRRVGIATFYRLLREHGTAKAALDALPEVAREASVSGYKICPEGVALAEMRAAHAKGARMVCIGSPDYPVSLTEIPDPPPILWVMGQLDILQRPMIAMVGARNASSLGTRMAKSLAKDLASEGYVVVSGLARGIDAAAHNATLETGTVAVFAGGVDVMYPAENTRLAENILAHGLRVSEQPMGLIPHARHFPVRNRIISGMSRAVVIVEAAARSGSLITARNALDQGREVLSVPGHPLDSRASGCNMLIRDGAHLVRNAADVIEALAPLAKPADPAQHSMDLGTAPPPPPEQRGLKETAQLHGQILQRLGPSPVAEDQLIRDLVTPARLVAPVLVDLELDGKIRRQPGGLLSLVN